MGDSVDLRVLDVSVVEGVGGLVGDDAEVQWGLETSSDDEPGVCIIRATSFIILDRVTRERKRERELAFNAVDRKQREKRMNALKSTPKICFFVLERKCVLDLGL